MEPQAAPFRVWWDETAEVAQVLWTPGSTVDLAAAQASADAVRGLGHGDVRMLVDIRGIKVFDRAARTFFLDDQGGSAAMALLAGSAVNKMLANFFIGMRRLSIPVKMFTDPAAALAWLREQR
jgi:hypothetical protein